MRSPCCAACWRRREPPAEIVVADDGSGVATREVVAAFAAVAPIPGPATLWQPHAGFRADAPAQPGHRAARSDYLVFVDGDMVAAPASSSPIIARLARRG